jgi:hypothetical protein
VRRPHSKIREISNQILREYHSKLEAKEKPLMRN